MKVNMKRIAKYTGAVCEATGVVALSGLVASGAAVGAVVEGFKAAAGTMKKMMAGDSQIEEAQIEETSVAQAERDEQIAEAQKRQAEVQARIDAAKGKK